MEAAIKQLKKRKVLEVPDGAKAEYLTRTFDESGVEILKKAIEQDIHKFSHELVRETLFEQNLEEYG